MWVKVVKAPNIRNLLLQERDFFDFTDDLSVWETSVPFLLERNLGKVLKAKPENIYTAQAIQDVWPDMKTVRIHFDASSYGRPVPMEYLQIIPGCPNCNEPLSLYTPP